MVAMKFTVPLNICILLVTKPPLLKRKKSLAELADETRRPPPIAHTTKIKLIPKNPGDAPVNGKNPNEKKIIKLRPLTAEEKEAILQEGNRSASIKPKENAYARL